MQCGALLAPSRQPTPEAGGISRSETSPRRFEVSVLQSVRCTRKWTTSTEHALPTGHGVAMVPTELLVMMVIAVMMVTWLPWWCCLFYSVLNNNVVLVRAAAWAAVLSSFSVDLTLFIQASDNNGL